MLGGKGRGKKRGGPRGWHPIIFSFFQKEGGFYSFVGFSSMLFIVFLVYTLPLFSHV